jgi:hypothetical protein
MSELAHLLHQFLAARNLPPAVPDGHGGLSFYADADLAVRAIMTADERLEILANPGYLSQAQLEALAEDDDDDDDDEPGLLMDWESPAARWSLRADLSCGLVMLSQTLPDMPQDAETMDCVIESMRETVAEWTARLSGQPWASAA